MPESEATLSGLFFFFLQLFPTCFSGTLFKKSTSYQRLARSVKQANRQRKRAAVRITSQSAQNKLPQQREEKPQATLKMVPPRWRWHMCKVEIDDGEKKWVGVQWWGIFSRGRHRCRLFESVVVCWQEVEDLSSLWVLEVPPTWLAAVDVPGEQRDGVFYAILTSSATERERKEQKTNTSLHFRLFVVTGRKVLLVCRWKTESVMTGYESVTDLAQGKHTFKHRFKLCQTLCFYAVNLK